MRPPVLSQAARMSFLRTSVTGLGFNSRGDPTHTPGVQQPSGGILRDVRYRDRQRLGGMLTPSAIQQLRHEAKETSALAHLRPENKLELTQVVLPRAGNPPARAAPGEFSSGAPCAEH